MTQKKAVLRVRDHGPRAKGESFKVEARVGCLFRPQDRFIVPAEFRDLIVEDIRVRAEKQMAVAPLPLNSFESQPLGSGWKMDALRPSDIMTFYFRAHADVVDVHFDVMGIHVEKTEAYLYDVTIQ